MQKLPRIKNTDFGIELTRAIEIERYMLHRMLDITDANGMFMDAQQVLAKATLNLGLNDSAETAMAAYTIGWNNGHEAKRLSIEIAEEEVEEAANANHQENQ